ncbi:MAG: hypothetical protein ABIL62_13410, partial [Planctomycetota bacterium]
NQSERGFLMATEAQTCAIGIRANRPNAIRYTLYAIRCTNYAKQTQFPKKSNERKYLFTDGL